jgi:hypothetical protein
MISHIEKLRLEPGDIIVVKDAETLHALSGLGKVVNFTVPLVFAPQGIQKLQRQDLLNLLEQLETPPVEPLLPNERTSAPL